MSNEATTAPIATLLENHRAFLRYLERRVRPRLGRFDRRLEFLQ